MGRLVVVILLGLLAGCSRTPVHRGKDAADWTQALHDPKVRAQAARSLGALGKNSEAAVPDLIDALKDADEKVRADAAEALWNLGPCAKGAVPALAAALKDRAPAVRLNAAGALGEIGPDARSAVPALTKVLRDPDTTVRDAAT
jgi:HEAT repeat protein